MRSAWIVLGSLALLLGPPSASPAAAEWFADGYLGVAITQNDEFRVASPFPGVTVKGETTLVSLTPEGARPSLLPCA